MRLLFLLILFPAVVLVIKNTTLQEKPTISGSYSQAGKATEALEYCKRKGFDTDFCILLDMKFVERSP